VLKHLSRDAAFVTRPLLAVGRRTPSAEAEPLFRRATGAGNPQKLVIYDQLIGKIGDATVRLYKAKKNRALLAPCTGT